MHDEPLSRHQPTPPPACVCSGDVALLQSFLVGDCDEETLVGSGSEGDDRDAVRFLAQRAIDPEYKARRAQGPFVVSACMQAHIVSCFKAALG